ncbi:MAG: type II toxin-antitoxin system HicB family antitoxin [Acidimicrobiaceae bacterium]|nr:type II toxin-antitoxin system HicB family antitoxin [Acidimicrobiaceae bacterium]MCY4279387.1 type II toxin-antitoxin system HicB family antitoxin [Acidimicrobiaceae bacterium]MCY4294905.1 type II toxin-antitoxin system HicB family antitoxin [Acidimicrobiaceae bacterium]
MKLKYVVVCERTANSWGAYVPDVLGCISVSDTYEETLKYIKEALIGHIELMLQDGDPLPEPTASIDDAIRSHLELLSEDFGEILQDFDETSLAVAVRFEPVEIEVRTPESSRETREPAQVG